MAPSWMSAGTLDCRNAREKQNTQRSRPTILLRQEEYITNKRTVPCTSCVTRRYVARRYFCARAEIEASRGTFEYAATPAKCAAFIRFSGIHVKLSQWQIGLAQHRKQLLNKKGDDYVR